MFESECAVGVGTMLEGSVVSDRRGIGFVAGAGFVVVCVLLCGVCSSFLCVFVVVLCVVLCVCCWGVCVCFCVW